MTKKFLFLFVFMFLMMPIVAFGQACSLDGTDPTLPPCSKVGYIYDSVQVGSGSGVTNESFTINIIVRTTLSLVNWLAWFIGLAAVVMGLYSGFLFITARDNANQIITARNTMMYAIIGIGVAILAFSLVSISRSLLGL